jgi:hypothetical protein
LNIPENQWALEKYAKYFFEVPLLFHPRYYHPQGRIPFLDILKSNKLAIPALELEWAWRDKPGALIKGFSISGFGRLTIPMISLGESRKLLGGFSSLESFDEYWKLLKESALFAKQPSIGGLIKCLEAMADGYVPQPYNYIYAPSLPWPILACLGSARNGEEIRELANRVRRGEMGGPEDWEGAELRWRSIGVTKEDLEYMTDERWPIPRDIARIGFPFAFLKYMWHMDHKIDKGEELQTFWQSLPGNRARGIFAEIIMQSYNRRAAPFRKSIESPSFPAELVVDIVSNLEKDQYWSADDLSTLLEKIADSPKAPHALDKIGRLISSRFLYVGAPERESVKKVVQFAAKILERDRSLDGIINLVSTLAASSTIDYVPGYFDELNLRNKSDGSKSRLILRLTQRGLDVNAIEQITREIFDDLGNDEDRIWMALKVYENHQMDNPNAVRFLEKLLELLPISFINARNQIIRILTDLLGRRVALLSERQIWNNLGLPQCLYDQIRN